MDIAKTNADADEIHEISKYLVAYNTRSSLKAYI